MPPTAYVVITSFARTAWHVPITERPQLLGRGSDAEFPVPSEFSFVSRRHAEVWSDDRGLWLKDLSSTAGTSVNGVRVEPGCEKRIAVGDRLSLGGLDLQVVAELVITPRARSGGEAGSPPARGDDRRTLRPRGS
jgi:predicted component of type VI protein secretion system